MDIFTVFIIILVVCGAVSLIGLLYCMFMVKRNTWVYNERSRILDENPVEYEKLVNYHTMMKKFWIWDINKFRERDINKFKKTRKWYGNI